MFVEVAKISDIAPGGLIAVEVQGERILLGNEQGQIYAVENRCGHIGAPFHTGGTLDGYILTCPLHFAQFDIRTGEALCAPMLRNTPNLETHNLTTYSVKLINDSIQVEI